LTTTQQRWLDKARESIQAAELMTQHGMNKIAVSRAYYAMFYVATALLLGKGLRFKSHSALIAAFGQHFAATGLVPKEYHRYLVHAFDERNVADYETEQELTAEDVKEKISHAQEFLQFAEQMLSQSNS
jgi:uncharacterized protein (UPF0332 family)